MKEHESCNPEFELKNSTNDFKFSNELVLKSFVTSAYSRIEELVKEIQFSTEKNQIEINNSLSSLTSSSHLEKKCQSIIEAIMFSFDVYFFHFVQVIQDQLQLLVESWKYKRNKMKYTQSISSKYTMSLIKNPHKLNFLVCKLIKIHKRRLYDHANIFILFKQKKNEK
jgi:hypothetical protein